MAGSQKKSTFFGAAAILLVSSLVVKGIGAIYKIPLGNILTDKAYADFDSAYAIYNVFLTISTAGLPVALSKTISEANTLGRQNQVQKVFRVAFCAFLTMGLISFFCMSVLAAPLSTYVLRNEKAVYCVLALAPSVLCVCVMSSFRGYFQGHLNMVPTGVSQVIEAACKLVLGLALAMLFLRMEVQDPNVPDLGERLPAVGAIIGVSFGSVVALAFILFLYFRHRSGIPPATDQPDDSRRILTSLLKLAVPITLSSAATSLVTLVDGSLVMSQLRSVFETVRGMGPDAALDMARSLKGIYGKCMAIYNLPFSLMVPITACIIPAVSAALARRDKEEARQVSESALRVGLLFAMPMGFGLFALGGPIMALLFPSIDSAIAGPLLSVLGLASVFVSIQLLCNSILQANGLVNLPIIAVLAGGLVKIAVNYILVGDPNILINGAPVGTLCCFIIMVLLEALFIRRGIPDPPSILGPALKPLCASVVMALAAWAFHGLLKPALGNALATLGGIVAGVLVYAVLILALRAIRPQDLALMPKGDKIAKILKIQ